MVKHLFEKSENYNTLSLCQLEHYRNISVKYEILKTLLSNKQIELL